MSPTVERRLAEIRDLLRGHTDRAEEGRILEILEQADAADLNRLLSGLDLHDLFEDVENRRVGPDHRAALFRLLGRDRVAELEIPTRVRVVDALQRGPTAGEQERLIRDLFLATRGADVTALKNGIDRGGDYRDLQQLIFHDVDDATVRLEILAHVAREGSSPEVKRPEVKLLSDIDDTFYSSLKDERYPRETVYPGVIPFYRELDRAPGGGRRGDGRRGDIAFLTARPRERAGVVEEKTQRMIRERGLGDVIVLSGAFDSLLSNEAMAEKKYENFVEYRRLFPEYGFVFCGDSGQGDAIFGERIRADFPGDVRAVFIHDVVDTSDADRARWLARGVRLVDTWVAAAAQACREGLLPADGLRRVIDAAEAEFEQVDFGRARNPAAARDLQERFARDVADARALL